MKEYRGYYTNAVPLIWQDHINELAEAMVITQNSHIGDNIRNYLHGYFCTELENEKKINDSTRATMSEEFARRDLSYGDIHKLFDKIYLFDRFMCRLIISEFVLGTPLQKPSCYSRT